MWGGVYGFAICASPKFGFFLISTVSTKASPSRSTFRIWERLFDKIIAGLHSSTNFNSLNTSICPIFKHTFVSTGKIINHARATLDLKFVKQYGPPKKARVSFKNLSPQSSHRFQSNQGTILKDQPSEAFVFAEEGKSHPSIKFSCVHYCTANFILNM